MLPLPYLRPNRVLVWSGCGPDLPLDGVPARKGAEFAEVFAVSPVKRLGNVAEPPVTPGSRTKREIGSR